MFRGILVCVDYADILSITLPWNRKHFDEMMIVTTPVDEKTLAIAVENKCRTFVTNAFYADNASFNKWKALEDALDYYGRRGWICLMDADVLWPKNCVWPHLEIGKLYTPHRRMYPALPRHAIDIPPENEWDRYAVHHNVGEFAGYTQVFHTSDPVLKQTPWHETNWRHAGGADSFFQRKWNPMNKVRPSFDVLHLGPAGHNWCGRASPYADGTRHPQAEARLSQLRLFIAGRRINRSKDRFSHERTRER